jgi:ABC-type transport system involved in multi-copper enzyme maturation permease subunit
VILVPVIERELRSEARNTFTYWLRVIGAAALLITGASFWVLEGVGFGRGGEWFGAMHQALFWSIWVLVPPMTADCISREKREGTLGLLFLTPLRASEVVLAKGLAHGLRAAALGLASIPVLALPFLMGGVSWAEALASLLINFSALCWALAAGLLASSRNRTLSRALVASAAWTVLFFLLFAVAQGIGAIVVMSLWAPGFLARVGGWSEMVERVLGLGYVATLKFRWFWENMRFFGPRGMFPIGAASVAGVALFSVLAFLALIGATAANVQRLWQDRPRSALQMEVEKQLCRPSFGKGVYRAWMRRLIERNPVGWLERRTWQARMVTWAWIAVVGCVVSAAASDPQFFRSNSLEWLTTLAAMLCASMALSSAGSFRRERETGVMELLLVSPLGVSRIIRGRLRGLWGQFGPGVGLFVASWLYLIPVLARPFGGMDEGAAVVGVLWLFCNTALTLPVMGLYLSMRCRLFILAAVVTMAGAVFVPAMAAMLLADWFDGGPGHLMGIIVQLVGAVVLPLAGVTVVRWWRSTARSGWMTEVLLVSAGLSATGLILIGSFGENRDTVKAMRGAVFLATTFQTVLAVWLGARLSRDLHARTFSLPQ